MWYAGSKGKWGYTEDEGKTWHHDSIQIEGLELEFRSIAITKEAVFLLNVGSPALLFRSTDKGSTWEIVYKEEDPATFYNSMAFWDDEEGIAVGDPIEGCLSVLITRDGGFSWGKLSCDLLPSVFENEAGFAASNTNIALYGDHAWLVSGGAKARVFHSPDRSASWEVFETPIIQGGKMTGIFSVDFYDKNKGIIFGGDWENQSGNKSNKAITSDGGKSWKLIADGQEPGYRSCVQYVRGTKSQEIFAVGMPGISYSGDFGQTWKALSNHSFYTIRFPDSANFAWLAGKNALAKMEWD